MKEIIDNFSGHAPEYKQFRPVYPPELYALILSHCRARHSCWDCATGNGQVALQLADHFEQVCATDISANQLAQAGRRHNIHYSVQRAESTDFPDDHFDLVTVAQAFHWFDQPAFNREVRRVTRPGGLVAVWGYGLVRLHAKVNALIDRFYNQRVRQYWNAERRFIESHYTTIQFDLEEIEPPPGMFIRLDWTFEQLIGYLSTWSSVRRLQQQHPGSDPVGELAGPLRECWGSAERQTVRFPLFFRMGYVHD